MKLTLLKRSFVALFLTVFITSSFAKENPRLIIRMDDMGAFHSVNEAFLKAYPHEIMSSVELMVVTPWFPEAVKMLRQMPKVDVGLHLAITSEWENIKWRPLTSCPSLTDENGYFYPMMGEHPAYPGQSILENKWDILEIEQEFRAQIELALKNVPQISHISGHMGATGFDAEVVKVVRRLAEEYNLPAIDRVGAMEEYQFTYAGYDGPKQTSAEKEAAFIKMLGNLEPGKNYMFIDHPALNNDEMQTVGHIGYEDVAVDRQGVTDFITSEKVKQAIADYGIEIISYNDLTKPLPRTSPAAEKVNVKGIANFMEAMRKKGHDLHSLMIVRNGNVVYEEWLGDNAANKPHILNSVSKTFAATAVGFAVAENRLKVTDKVIGFFPEYLPATISDNLKALTVENLLTMTTGHDVDPTRVVRSKTGDGDWERGFFNEPLLHTPGTYYVYNSLATYMLSAIVQKVTGEKIIDYLYPRLFRPLGIVGAEWQESPSGVNTGGWGLFVKTEDMAKLGQFILQKGMWNGKQLLPESWIAEATSAKVPSAPAGVRPEDVTMKPKDSDWLQGYGYQMWRCRHNAVRADGANGQYIIILPEKNTVIAITTNIGDMQDEINQVWRYILPALRN